MKKFVIILLILILIVLMGVGCYFLFFSEQEERKPSGDNKSGDVFISASEKIVVDTAVTKTETTRRNIDVKMPTFMNLSDYSFQETINKKIADSINPYIHEIAIVADGTTTKQYKYIVSFERYNNDDYVSLVILQNYYTGSDGMRSNVWKDTYTVDVVNNRELTLADICDITDYKKVIVAEVNKQASDKNIELIAGNGLADIPDTQRFYIKDKKLYIYFEPASIAPYLDGEMHFEMPFSYVNGKFIVK